MCLSIGEKDILTEHGNFRNIRVLDFPVEQLQEMTCRGLFYSETPKFSSVVCR